MLKQSGIIRGLDHDGIAVVFDSRENNRAACPSRKTQAAAGRIGPVQLQGNRMSAAGAGTSWSAPC